MYYLETEHVAYSSNKQSEKNYLTSHRGKCINGRKTLRSNCVGFCRFKGHPGFLTKELRKKHDCIHKNCDYYLPKFQVLL